MELSEAQIRRYSRHILLPDVGGVGQRRLLAATVGVALEPPLGAAAVALAYLAAAGVGTLRLGAGASQPVSEQDAHDAILLGPGDVGRPRGDAVAERLAALNPDVSIERGDAPLRPDLPPAGAGDVAGALISGGAAAARLVAAIARG